MARGWQPTPTERAATDSAVFAIGVSIWTDDLRQAALIALWETSDTRDRSHYAWAHQVASRAAIDELRRLTHARAKPITVWPVWTRRGLTSADGYSGPEHWLRARQALALLIGMPERHRQALTAVLETDTRREAAQRLGVDPSRINHLLDGRPDRPGVRDVLSAAI